MSVQMREVEEGPLKDLLWAHFTSTFRKGYLWAEDSIMPQFYGRFAQGVKDFQVRSSDSWVTSFPKCGTPNTQIFIYTYLLSSSRFENKN